MDRGAVVAPLRSTAFRRYVIGQLGSVACSWAQVVALAWVVVELDPKSLGWVVALQFLPSLLLGPWFGVVVDRHDRRQLLILAEAGLGLVALGYVAAAETDQLTMPIVYLLALAWGVINALDTPARRALVPMLVPPHAVASAAALTGTVMVLGMAIGTALGAALVAASGVTVAFAVNAGSFFLDVVLLVTIRVPASPRVLRATHQIRDGLTYVWQSAPLRAAMLAVAIMGTCSFTVQVSVPIFASEAFAGGPGLVGGFLTAVTGGSLLGTVVFAARAAPSQRSLRRTAVAMCVAMLATALAPHQFVALAGLAAVGLTWSYLISAVVATLQTAQPHMMGRVMSLFAVVMLGGTTVGAPLATGLIEIAGARAPFAAGAVAAVIGAVVLGSERADQPAATTSLARLR